MEGRSVTLQPGKLQETTDKLSYGWQDLKFSPRKTSTALPGSYHVEFLHVGGVYLARFIRQAIPSEAGGSMAGEDEQALDVETKQRIRADLDRFMQSDGLAEARDIVAGNPLLLGSHVADFLGEAVKRLRQLGHVEQAQSCEFSLGLLRTFREFGVQEGYLERAMDELMYAQTPEDHRRVLRQYPELAGETAAAYIKRRLHESVSVADTDAEGKYRLVGTIVSTTSIDDSETDDARINEAVNTFVREFIHQPDFAAQQRLLESRPDLMQSPGSLIVGSMFQPFIERARAGNHLVTLRDLLLRQALFARCQEVGVAQAFEELAKGVKWKQLTNK